MDGPFKEAELPFPTMPGGHMVECLGSGFRGATSNSCASADAIVCVASNLVRSGLHGVEP